MYSTTRFSAIILTLSIPAEDVVVLGIEFNIVLLDVKKQLVRAKDLGDFHQLVVIIVPMEERFFAKDLHTKR